MKTIAIIGIALIIWIAGIQGNLGSILAAIIDPGSLVEGTPPSQAPPGTFGGNDAGGLGGGASGNYGG